tara:strand:- start:816 stop:1250 length:435 start_codon:yes stop_codon:yes gene_type:complete
MLDRTFFFNISTNVRDRYRDFVFFGKRKDVFGKNYPSYSESYKKAKRSGKVKRQSSQYSGYNSPVLSGDLANDVTPKKITNNGFQLVFAAHGAKVEWLRKMKKPRIVSDPDQPLPNEVIKYLSNKAQRYMASKRPQGKKTYRIG